MNPREYAIAHIRSILGLNADPSSWSYEQRVAYNRALATYIAANPELFSAQETQIASGVLNSQNALLSDNGFLSDLSVFGSALGDQISNAGEAVGGVGRGVLNFARLSEWLIPAALTVVVVIMLIAINKKVS